MLKIFVIFLTFATTLVLSDDPYIPCQNWVTFLADTSNKLTKTQFNAQIMFIELVMEKINHFERIQYGVYFGRDGNMTYGWNGNNTAAGILQNVEDTLQTSQPPSLAGAMLVLENYANKNSTAIIFVTDTSNAIQISIALNYYNSALKGKVKLTFIMAGDKSDGTALKGFDDAIFYNWQNIEIFDEPDGWNLTTAFRCTQQMATPTPSMIPYIPCQSWIYFGIDDSVVLDPSSFTVQKSFISSAVGNITHPNRIAAGGIYSSPFFWDSGFTIPQMQHSINAVYQEGPYSLRQQFNALLLNLEDLDTGNLPIATLIFVPDTSDSALVGADQPFRQLSGIRITFVLLGPNPDQTKLTKYSSNFINWRDFSQSQPNNWNTLSNAAYGCQ